MLVLINYILTYQSKENTGYNKFKITTFVLGIFFIIFSETTIRFVSNNLIFNSYISFIPIFAFTVLYLKTFKTIEMKLKKT